MTNEENGAKPAADVTSSSLYDLTIIGAGPIGLYALFYAGMRGLKTKIIDSLPELGGQLMALYPEKYIYDVAGLPKVLSKELAQNLIMQGLQFGAEVVVNEKIIDLKRNGDDNIITLSSEKGNVHRSKTVLIAMGAGAFVPKKLDIQDVDRLEGKGLFYTVKDTEFFRDKRILIVGGGDSAVDWANHLPEVARELILIHRREKFRAHEASVQEMFNRGEVNVKLFYELKRIHGTDYVEGATIFSNKTGEEEELKLDAILINIGFLANLDFLAKWNLRLQGNSVLVDDKMRTNIDGVFSAGDICTFPAKLKLISTGSGEAAIAVNFAATYINPDERAFPGHSSNMEFNVGTGVGSPSKTAPV